MQRTRRTFLRWALGGTGAALGAASWWVTASQRRGARWVRRLIQEARRPVLPATCTPEPGKWSDNEVTLCWLGHSTVLLNFYGVNVLTDPVLGDHVGVSIGLGTAGPKRYTAPALRFEELPPIDLIVLSHAHMDHMDLPTLRRFSPEVSVITAKATGDLLEGSRLRRVSELGWNDRMVCRTSRGEVEVEALEVKHWGQRWPSEKPRGYNGYVLRRESKSLLFAGDSARTALFSEHRARGPFHLAIMPIGAYRPWIRNHCAPEEAVEMANWANAGYLVPVHHATFKLSDEPMAEPLERFEAALAQEPERLALRRVGETFVCPKAG